LQVDLIHENLCLSREVLEHSILFVSRKTFETTISIDGPPPINDALRMYKGGKPVSEQVVRSINELQAIGVKVTIETVYTAHHISQQYSINDCMEFVKSLGINELILQPAYPPARREVNPLSDSTIENYIAYYMEAVDRWCEDFVDDGKIFGIYFKDILKIMLEDSPSMPSGCPAGVTSYSVGPDGSIYPCQLLYGKPRLHMGNVSDEGFVLNCTNIPEIHTEPDECRSCYARHWCQPCAALNDFFGDIAHPSKSECAVRKAVILRIAQWASERLVLPENEYTEILREKLALFRSKTPCCELVSS